MRKNLVALGVAGAIALSGAMAVPPAALADEPPAGVADGVPSAAADESGLTLPPNAAENDSLGDYTDPKNPVDVQLKRSYTVSGKPWRYPDLCWIGGIQYKLSHVMDPAERTWSANVLNQEYKDSDTEQMLQHFPAESVVIPDSINGLPVTSVRASGDDCKNLVLGSNVRGYVGDGASLESLTFVKVSVLRLDGSWSIGLAEDGNIYLPEDISPCELDAVKTYIAGKQINGASSDYGDIKAIIPYLRVGTPEASDPLVVDDKQMFAYRMRGDSAELYCCVYNDEYSYFNFKNVAIDSSVSGVPVTSIGSHAIDTCKGSNWGGRESVLTIPATVREVKSGAFGSALFETVVLADGTSLKVIGDRAFGPAAQNGGPRNFGPEGSKGIVIPVGVESIGSSAFQNSGATSVAFEDGCAAVIAPDAFGGTPNDNNVSKVTVPPTVTVADGGSLADVFPLAAKGEDGQAKTFEVSFGDAGLEPVNVPFAANLAEVELPAAERAGYSFAGWVLADGEALSDAPLVTDDVELCATWALAAPTVAVTVDVEEPVEGDTVTLTAKVEHPLLGGEGDALKVSYQWAKDGETVDGATAGTLKVTEPGAYVANVAVEDADGLTATASSAPVAVEFAARPEPKPETFTVTFVLGNGDDDIVHKVVDGERVSRPDDPVRAGYKFAGWFTAVDEDGKLSDEFDFDAPVTSDLTVYAGWVPAGPDPQPEPEPGETPDLGDDGNDGAGDNAGDADKGDKLPTTGDPAALAGLVAAAGIAAAACGTIRRKR